MQHHKLLTSALLALQIFKSKWIENFLVFVVYLPCIVVTYDSCHYPGDVKKRVVLRKVGFEQNYYTFGRPRKFYSSYNSCKPQISRYFASDPSVLCHQSRLVTLV